MTPSRLTSTRHRPNLIHAVLWQNGTVIDLGNRGGTDPGLNAPLGIPNHGQVGWLVRLARGTTTFRAFLRGIQCYYGPGHASRRSSSPGQGITPKADMVGQLVHRALSDLQRHTPRAWWDHGPGQSHPRQLLRCLHWKDHTSRIGDTEGLAFQQSVSRVHAFLAHPRHEKNDQGRQQPPRSRPLLVHKAGQVQVLPIALLENASQPASTATGPPLPYPETGCASASVLGGVPSPMNFSAKKQRRRRNSYPDQC